jgi:hypothetical protein
MLVNVIAHIREDADLAANHPDPDWPINLRVSDGRGQTVFQSEGKLKAGELRGVLLMPGASASDPSAIPRFLKDLMGRNVAEIRELELPDIGLQALRNFAMMP